MKARATVRSNSRKGKPPESGTDPFRLARLFVQRMGQDRKGRLTLRHWREQWWRYEDGQYVALELGTIRKEVTAEIKAIFDEEKLTDRQGFVFRVVQGTVSNTVLALTALVDVPEGVSQPVWLGEGEERQFFAMTNGLVDRGRLLSGQVAITPPTPEWFSPVRFPYPFEESADCPRWRQFLDEVLEADSERIALLQEFFGYCLVHDTTQHKFLVLEGEGANGKSVALEILTQLVGPENTSNVPLDAFNGRFQLSSTLGKLVNVCTEVGEMDKPSEAVLKQFTAGDRMHFDRKHISPVEEYPTARLVLSANNRPQFSDGSGGLWRRMTLIPFRVVIPPERQDKQLVDKLKTELPGIFNWAIEGLRRLRRQGRFTSPAMCEQAVAEYRLESNPPRVFLTEHVTEDATAVTRALDLYSSYAGWADSHGYKPVDSRQFGKEVRRSFPRAERVKVSTSGGRREYAYRGLSHDPMTILYLPNPALPMMGSEGE